MYVSDIIGEKYKTWKKGDIILLTAPTGSGKTTFILNELLSYAIDKSAENKKKKEKDGIDINTVDYRIRILYLVNRRVLKEQLCAELNKRQSELSREKNLGMYGLDEYIAIATYQSIEQGLKSDKPYDTIQWIKRYYYIVCDECHYFMNDSNFNTYTELSFDCIRTYFDYKIQIYMSATISNTVDFIENRVSKRLSPTWYFDVKYEKRFKEYNIQRDYGYVKLKVFNNQEELKNIIIKNKDSRKWLIFTDSIVLGKELRDFLVEYLKNENSFSKNTDSQVGFIDAQFDNELEGTEIVDEIATKDMTSKRILIATAVIDNGISFKDYNLRNIVIMADTEESFVQMLGRKRPDGQDVTVYICKRDEVYFNRRLQYINGILKLFEDIGLDCKQMYCQTEYEGNIYPFHICVTNLRNPHGTELPNIPIFIDFLKQSKVLDKIFSSTRYYNYAKKICYHLYGCIAINSFAVRKYQILQGLYAKMISELQQDENAFIRKQASWLGKDDSEVEAAINESTVVLDEIHRNTLNTVINQYLDNEMDEKENIKMNEKAVNELRYFLEKYSPVNEEEKKEKEKFDNMVRKNDRALRPPAFNKIMELAELPYIMEKPNGSTFIIKSK